MKFHEMLVQVVLRFWKSMTLHYIDKFNIKSKIFGSDLGIRIGVDGALGSLKVISILDSFEGIHAKSVLSSTVSKDLSSFTIIS